MEPLSHRYRILQRFVRIAIESQFLNKIKQQNNRRYLSQLTNKTYITFNLSLNKVPNDTLINSVQ